jgi:hypothetical protein
MMGLDKTRLSDCHRLLLSREWLGSGGTVNWIMLNPSTADDVFDDPTIRKCRGFSQRWGFSRLVVTNLFTFRASAPGDMKTCAQNDWARAIGYADKALIEQAEQADLIVAAWGLHGNFMGRADDVLARVLPTTKLYCIGKTKYGFPLHPVMAAYISKPELFRDSNI